MHAEIVLTCLLFLKQTDSKSTPQSQHIEGVEG